MTGPLLASDLFCFPTISEIHDTGSETQLLQIFKYCTCLLFYTKAFSMIMKLNFISVLFRSRLVSATVYFRLQKSHFAII